MTPKPQTSKEYFNSLTILHAAMAIGQLLFGLVIYFQFSNAELTDEMNSMNDIFRIMVPAFIIGGLFTSELLFKTLLKKINQKTDLKERLIGYRSALIIKYALLEGPSLFAIIAFLVTSNLVFLGLSGFIILMFLTNRPTRFRAINDLLLNPSDKALIEDPEAIIA
jgi:hypothetical protein